MAYNNECCKIANVIVTCMWNHKMWVWWTHAKPWRYLQQPCKWHMVTVKHFLQSKINNDEKCKIKNVIVISTGNSLQILLVIMAFTKYRLWDAIVMNCVSCMSGCKLSDHNDDCRYERPLMEDVVVRWEERWDMWLDWQQHKGEWWLGRT